VKRADLHKRIKELGCLFIRHGGKHDWYQNPQSGVSQADPRHREITERLARNIIKKLARTTG
jgi:hypothetical protein